jgi:uncharacterized protein involved in exopolysaccharide biosynthesis
VKKGEAEIAARKRIDSLTRAIDADPALSQAARAAGESDKSILGLQLKSEEVNKAYEAIDEQLAKDRAGLAALEAQRAQLVDVRRVNAQHQPQLTAMFQKEAELARLTTDYEVAERSYKEIASKYDVARLQVASRSAQLQVIDRASVPTSPEPRHLLRNTTFGILAAATVMVIAIILAQALRDALNRGTRSAG